MYVSKARVIKHVCWGAVIDELYTELLSLYDW